MHDLNVRYREIVLPVAGDTVTLSSNRFDFRCASIGRLCPQSGTPVSFQKCPLSEEADIQAAEIGATLRVVCFQRDRTFRKIGSRSELRTKLPISHFVGMCDNGPLRTFRTEFKCCGGIPVCGHPQQWRKLFIVH
ncbi:hypothetical protein [Ruegeria lacuscaerulensis]|uniref:hypothetical protein n=1 Tax=Ruegeria lacuscaerulensis TaxID=55218 RepID=UPI0014798F54|nr:hypothetical protein [Ruegeria lacuscaerulensis]